MRKLQLWSTIKEIASVIDGWDNETFEKEIEKSEMTFVKFLPQPSNWSGMQKYVVKIKLTKERVDEEDGTTKSTQSD